MCGPKAAEAITYRQSPKSMFLCPSLLDGKTYKTSIEGNRKDTDKKIWGDIQNIPGVFIHEMMHWLDLKPASEHGMFLLSPMLDLLFMTSRLMRDKQ